MSSSSGKAKMPTINYDTGGLYGSGSAGKTNTFNPTGFQSNLVKTTENAIPDYINQMINPTYDSNVFKAQTVQRNKLANQSFENNLINPLASRGLTRGSSVNQMSNEFGKNLIDAEQAAMTQEDSRVANILSNLFNYYQIPYSMMNGLQSNAQNLVSAQMQADAQNRQSQSGLLGSMAGSIGSMLGSGGGSGGSGGDWTNSLINAGISAGTTALLAASDVRLKENINLLDNVDGYNIYEFDFIRGPKNQIGVIAQEMLDRQPDCVGIGDDGYYFVDYAKLPSHVRARLAELSEE